ncbi:MAG: hypothetical protein UU25_C0040G0030 [Microgenomates group bacterium GW2011_GWB1_40_9]|nr:MAG: hypothetical protein UU25_C0040G0030 [Microgenomates group bacterium GW2011_GWB1_40_9]
MTMTLFYFFVSFLGDFLAYIFYQQYIDGHKKNPWLLIYAVVSAFFVWVFIFKLQDRGQILRLFLPLWSAGTAVFGYFAAGFATKTPVKEMFSLQAIISIACIGIGIYFLQKLTAN